MSEDGIVCKGCHVSLPWDALIVDDMCTFCVREGKNK